MTLGTCIRFADTVVVYNGGTVDTVQITITDPGGTPKITDQDMTSEGSGVYSYVYQSAVGDDAGEYIAVITVTSGSYVGKTKQTFSLS